MSKPNLRYPRPPRFASSLLALMITSDMRDEILGDMDETYRDKSLNEGVLAARGWYRRQALMSTQDLLWHKVSTAPIMMAVGATFLSILTAFTVSLVFCVIAAAFFTPVHVDGMAVEHVIPLTLIWSLACTITGGMVIHRQLQDGDGTHIPFWPFIALGVFIILPDFIFVENDPSGPQTVFRIVSIFGAMTGLMLSGRAARMVRT
jgi:hypothetical protein